METLQSSEESGIRSVDRALRLVTAVVESRDGLGLVEAARITELAPSTATRILRTLVEARFVDRRDDGQYVAGAELVRLSALQTSESPLLTAAQPQLDLLAAETGESSYLAVAVDQTWATYVRMAQSTKSVRHVSWLGRQIPLATSATGSALQGTLNRQGIAVMQNGVEPDTTAFAIPICDRGAAIATVTVVAPSFRVDKTARTAITVGLRAAGTAIESSLRRGVGGSTGGPSRRGS